MPVATPDAASAVPAALLALRGIGKAYAGVQALQDVDFAVAPGEVHALLGENGAGKSTLMKIMFGVVRPDAGEITLDGGEPVSIAGPRHALALGIGLVSQELSLVPQLDVAQNVFLGQSGALRIVPRARQRRIAADLLRPLAPEISVTAKVGSLGTAARQVVEIVRTLARGGRVIAFDEPTSSLTPTERDALFRIIADLKAAGRGIIYISHRMPEVHAIADRVTVLRDGRVVASGSIAQFAAGELDTLIAGRALAGEAKRPEGRPADDAAISVRMRNVFTGRLRGIDLDLRHGEIFGLAGLVGSGRTELARCLFGADRRSAGTIELGGSALDISSPAQACAAGIALIPEDRRGQALVGVMEVEQNFGLPNAAFYTRGGFVTRLLRRRDTLAYCDELSIRPRRPRLRIRGLSGGNQQKVVIARWLRYGARVLLFDEPTRGIDVGAKAEIHAILRRLAAEGRTVLMISSELPELLALADRIGVMRDGRLVDVVANTPGLSEGALMRLASGVDLA